MVVGRCVDICQIAPTTQSAAAFALVSAIVASTTATAAAPASASAPASAPASVPASASASASAPGRSVFPGRVRPTAVEAPVVACSFVSPVCVHAPSVVAGDAVLRTLAAAERFFLGIAALGYPMPLSDGERGGDARYDVYLSFDVTTPLTVPDEIATGSGFDQTSAFTVLPPPLVAAGCVFDSALARALTHALVLRFDAGAENASIAMAQSYLASSLVDCYVEEDQAIDDFQRDPERSFARGEPDQMTGSFLFPRFLDDHYGTGAPGAVLFGLLSVAAQRTAANSLFFSNEPDLFDALRSNSRAREKPFEDLLLDFAVARAFVGSRSDGGHLSDVAKYGSFGRARFEWSIPWSSLPRRLAPMRPIEPLGATYLWLDLQGAPDDGEFGFVVDWELGVLFHWALVKIDASGAEVGRVQIGGINGATHAERTLIGFKGLSGILVVGTNTGSIDRSHPYDPDESNAPRGYTMFLVK